MTVISNTSTIAAGTTESGDTVVAGGELIVASGGLVEYSVLSTGGALLVSAGGSGYGLTIGAGGTATLYGTAHTVAVNGMLAVESGGIDSGSTDGSGGLETVFAGGTASASDVYIGELVISAGGTAATPTIASEGLLDLAAGAIVTGPINFVADGPGGELEIDGGSVTTAAITNFAATDSIDLTGLTFGAGGTATLGAGDVLSVTEGGTTDTLQLDATVAGATFILAADSGTGTLITEAACYVAGTAIATPDGAIAVEALRPGDFVLAQAEPGDAAGFVPMPVRWVGRTRVDLARHPHPAQAAPVRIRAAAIAPGIPARDLLVSPDHALFLDGALIQARALLNGATVVQECPADVRYVHVELDCHAVILAEAMPAESYLDTGNRALFAGEPGTRPLHPDFAAAAVWDARACAPLLLGGARVAAAHAAVLARAAELGFALADDAGLTVEGLGTRAVRFASRSFVPAWLGLGDDRRRLGVAVAGLRLDGRKLAASAFGPGWHAAEPGWRWTDGDASLTLPRPGKLTWTLVPVSARYWAGMELAQRRAG